MDISAAATTAAVAPVTARVNMNKKPPSPCGGEVEIDGAVTPAKNRKSPINGSVNGIHHMPCATNITTVCVPTSHRRTGSDKKVGDPQDSTMKPPENGAMSLRQKRLDSIYQKLQPKLFAAKRVEELLFDDKFLTRLFFYFWPFERCVLAQVCKKWRAILYQTKFWRDFTPILHRRDLYDSIQKADEKRFTDLSSFYQKGIENVCLVNVSDLDICEFIDNYPQSKKCIKAISLKRSTVTDAGLEVMLEQLTTVNKLELSGCNDFTEAGLWSSLNPRITSLGISDCINVGDDSVAAIAQRLPCLHELNLQAYHVTDNVMSYFTPKQSCTMSILRLRSCWEITNHAILNIVHTLPHLTTLSLSGCSKITDDGVELIAENMHMLKSLDLSWCPRITDASLEYIACDLPKLEELILDRCVRITDTGMGFLSTMSCMKTLYLRWCCQVQDFGLQHLYSMRTLHVLSLAGCPLLTSAGLSGLVQLRNLEELELTNCPGSSPELIQYFMMHLPWCVVIQ
uniref:F-box/LRR-repeat protein 16-like n=1 Tax=Saccoglossus kowalevskii TaxID=10224 RepID=A0ABM0H145_SACKO|nr:PREDICTED: F-box/LRR-repeat protein 16-like [Saccoglossus kowalevskii]